MDEKLSPQEFATKVKSKYPEYKDIDDVTLAQRVIEKYPEYADRVSMDEGGLSQQPTEDTQDLPPAEEDPRSLLEKANFIAGDLANQFNLGVANMIGAPVDLIAAGLNKASNKIIGKDIVADDSFGGSKSIQRGLSALPGVEVVDEEPQTAAGYVGQTAVEAVTFFLPSLKAAQMLSKAQPASTGGKVLQRISNQFLNETRENVGRVLAIESGAATAAGLARYAANEADLSPGQSMAVEILAGIAGGFGGAGLAKKVQGKTATEVMEMVSNGTIEYKDLTFIQKPEVEGKYGFKPVEFGQARQEILTNVTNKQKSELALDTVKLESYNPDSPFNLKKKVNKLLSVFAPSKVVGREIMDEIDKAKGTLARAEDVGARVHRAAKRLEKADPAIREKIDTFIKGGEMDSSLRPIEAELITWRGLVNEMQASLLENIDEAYFDGLTKSQQKDLRDIVESSMKENSYVTQTYKIFQDPDYIPTKAQEQDAIKEIQTKILMSSDAGTMTVEQAEEMAIKQINHLKKQSARQRKIDGRPQGIVKESKGITRQRTNPGPAERAWLGEVTDPGERAFSTASRISRLASAQAEDIAIARLLLDKKIATRQAANPDQVQMTFRTIDGDSSIWIDPEVAHSLDVLRFNNAITEPKAGIAKYIDRFWNQWVGFSKTSNVLFNPESYAINTFGAMVATISSGIMPSAKGLRVALSDFGGLDNILSGKNKEARLAFLKDVGKMNQYGLKPKSVNAADIEQNVIRGLKGLNGSVSKGISGFMDFFGKAYSIGDTALRYVTWKGNQKQLAKIFPDYSVQEIEAAAAKLTNQTFQNYDKLSVIIRQLTRLGAAQQYVAFTAELTRNMYNQGKYVSQMAAGRFGKDIGLDPARANVKAMRITAAKRGAALAAAVSGSSVLVSEFNQGKGIDEKASEQFGYSIAPDWDSSKNLMILPDASGRKGRYINPDYLIPQNMAAQAFAAGTSEAPIKNMAEFIKGYYLGEPGTFPARALAQIAFGRDLNGKLISVDPRGLEKAKDAFDVIYEETLETGAERTLQRFIDSSKGIGDRTMLNNAMRLLGIRDYNWDADVSFKMNFANVNEPMRQAKSNYSSAMRKFEDNKISAEELESEYQRNNEARSLQLDIMRKHYANMGGGTWKYNQDERIKLMKEAGVASSDILDIIFNRYTDIPKTKTLSTEDVYSNLGGTTKEKMNGIKEVAKSDPLMGRKLLLHHKQMLKVEQRNISEFDKLLIGLSPNDRAEYLISIGADKNNALLREMARKGIATKGVLQAMQIKGRQ
jgi:hypothetical protein